MGLFSRLVRPLKYPWLWWKVIWLFLRLVRPLKQSWPWWKAMWLFSWISYLEVGEPPEVVMALVEGGRAVLWIFLLSWGWWGPWSSHGFGGRWWCCSLGFLTLRLVRPLKYSWFCWKVMGLFSRLRFSSLYIFWRTLFGMSRMLLLLRSRTFSFAVAGIFK